MAAAFFKEHGREFPWRCESDPYRLAVAEIVLQKTRAASALPVYEALLTEYPTAPALAKGGEEALASILRPIGLSKKRAVQLRTMASEVVRHGDALFSDWPRLLADVPGLGAYGSRAIACFAQGERVGIVDANIARIFRRIFRVASTDPRAIVYQRIADAVAERAADPRETNFGLLDVGATVCLPRPRCASCPFSDLCPRFGVPAESSRQPRMRRGIGEGTPRPALPRERA
jgi:A/G-specific adenine glycosylase